MLGFLVCILWVDQYFEPKYQDSHLYKPYKKAGFILLRSQ